MGIDLLWRDDVILNRGLGRKAFSGWQSGLVDERDRPKPALAAFANPFWIDTLRPLDGRPRFWGQVRPGASHTVTIERRLATGGGWSPVTTVGTDALGYFFTSVAVPAPADYRYAYTVPGRGLGARPVTVRSSVLPVRRDASVQPAPLVVRALR